MDNNVVFNPNTQNDPNAQVPDPNAQPPVSEVPPVQTPVDPNANPNFDPNPDPNPEPGNELPVDPTADTPVDPNADPNAQVLLDENGNEIPSDGSDLGYEEPPNFFQSGLFKKILIGLGILVFLIIIISVVGNFMKGAPKNVKLEWWGLWEDTPTMQVLINDFKKTHPNIDVVYVKKNPDQYREQVMTRIENGTGPDIFRYHNTWLPMLKKDVSALSADAITAEEFKNAYYPVMQHDLTKDGAIYGIPLEADTLELFVNPQLFQAAGQQVPTTWDEFNTAAKELTSKTPDGKINKAGAALGTYTNINHAPDVVSLLLVQQGVDINNIANFTQKEAGGLSYYGSFALSDKNVWDKTLPNSLLAFSKGDLAMYFGYSWDVFEIKKLNSNLKFKIYPVPSNQGIKTTIASYWVEGVSAKSANPKEAMEFMHYLAQKDTAQKFYTETTKSRASGEFGELYPRKDLQSSLQDNELAYPFVQGLDQASSSFFASNTRDGETGINSLMNSYLQKAVDALTPDPNSGQSVIDDLNNGVAQVLGKYAEQQ